MTQRDDGVFEPIANPFIVGNPIEDRRMFFGREDDFQYIRKKVSGARTGGLIVLCGSRRSGKTSILFQINGGRLGPDFVPVLIDMQAVTVGDDREFIARLALEIIEAIDDPQLTYEGDFPLEPGTNPFALFHRLVRKVNEVLGKRRLVLMFDEYELFETKIDKGNFSSDVLNMLGNWMETTAGVYVVFTGSDRIEKRNPRYWQAFMGKAIHRRISFLSRDDTLRLVLDPVGDQVAYADGIPERICDLTAGQPFYTQVIAQSIVDHLNEKRRRNVTDADLDQVVAEIVDNPLPQMVFSWTSLTDLEKVALSAIAELLRSGPGKVTAPDIREFLRKTGTGLKANAKKLNEALERLFSHDLLDKSQVGDAFAFKMDLWRLWTGRMHSIWKVVDELTGGGRKPGEGLEHTEGGNRRTFGIAILLTALAVVVALAFYQGYIPYGGEDPPPGPGPAPIDTVHVRIDGDPPGSEVRLDGALRGTSPADLRLIGSQARDLNISKTGFASIDTTLEFEPGEKSVQYTFILEELVGSLSVSSTPPGAVVILDGERTDSRTPCVLADLATARLHGVRLELAGYRTVDIRNIGVHPDSTTTVHRDLVVPTHYVTVVSDPDSAYVHLDGSSTPVGQTPYTLNAISHGDHTVRLEKSGFQTAERAFTIPAPDNMVFVDLVELPPGRVVFSVSPFAEEVLIDGNHRWNVVVRDSVDLKPGSYEFEFRRAGIAAQRMEVQVESGARQEVHCDLK